MKKTYYFIIGLVIIIAGYDFFIIETEGKEASISAVLIRWSYEYPSISFLTGFVAGHVFWRMKDKDVFGDKK